MARKDFVKDETQRERDGDGETGNAGEIVLASTSCLRSEPGGVHMLSAH